MNHPRIDDEHIVDRYLARRLAPPDEASFEEHLFECADCLEKVQWGDELRRGLRTVATEDATRASVAQGLAAIGWLAWLRNRRPGQLAGLISLALALVLLPAFILRQQAELRQARANARQALTAGGGQLEPMADLLVISLGVVRDAQEAAEIRLDPAKRAIALSLELPAVDAPHYRVILRDASDTELWRGDGLEPSLYDTLLVIVPTGFLAPGSYSITVESPAATGSELAGQLELRVLAEK
ncbi:MAG: zf-HC2 domain-containing protein [Acidobacteriota bacterium]